MAEKIGFGESIAGAVRLFVPLLAGALLLTFVFYRLEMATERQLLREEELESVEILRWALEGDLMTTVTDLHALATLRELVQYVQDPTAERIRLVAEVLSSYAQAKHLYDRIDLYDESGAGIVRIRFDEVAEIEADPAAPHEWEPAYVEEALSLEAEEIFITPAELKREGGVVVSPEHAVIRFGTALFDSDGSLRGALILSLRADGLLDHIAEVGKHVPGEAMLVDREGYWLRGGPEGKGWGHMYPDGAENTFAHAYPEVWARVESEFEGQIETADGLFTYIEARPISNGLYEYLHLGESVESQPLWHVITVVSPEHWAARTYRLRRPIVAAAAVIAVLLAVLSFFLARSRIRKRHLQQALMRSEQLYKTVAKNFPNGAVMLFDENLTCVLAEGRELTSLGLMSQDTSGKRLPDIFTPEVAEQVQRRRQSALESDMECFDLQVGDRTFQTFLVPVRGPNGEVFSELVMTQDISEQKRLELQLRRIASFDSLTGLHNRRHFLERLEGCMELAKRHKRPLSLCVCDIDHFKTVNDKYGHVVGDKLLVSFAQLIDAGVRLSDVPGRYGGDEFCIVFPDTTADQAKVVVERIRAALAAMILTTDSGAELQVTGSFGIADLPSPDASVAAFIDAADQQLYKAKQAGRNRVE